MIEVLVKNQFIEAFQNDNMRLRMRQIRPSTLWQALEAVLELEASQQTQTTCGEGGCPRR